MDTRGRSLRFAAVIGCVVLALTGFSTGRHHGVGKHHSSGGGCSSSSQDHDTSRHTTTTTGGNDSYSSTAAASPSPAMAVLVTCAGAKQPYATVEVSNPNTTADTFDVTVTFLDAKGGVVATRTDPARVPAGGTATVRAYVGGGDARLSRVDHCEVRDLAPASS